MGIVLMVFNIVLIEFFIEIEFDKIKNLKFF